MNYKKELKDLQTEGLFKSKLYSFEDVREIIKLVISEKEHNASSTVFTENNNQQESNGGRSLTSNNTSSPADTSYFNEKVNSK